MTYDPTQTLADLAAASQRMSTDVERAVAAVRRVPPIPPITRAGDLTLTAPNFPVAQFHDGGHGSQLPASSGPIKPPASLALGEGATNPHGSVGGSPSALGESPDELSALSRLHGTFTVPTGTVAPMAPTQDDLARATRHGQRGCAICSAWTRGVAQGGAAQRALLGAPKTNKAKRR